MSKLAAAGGSVNNNDEVVLVSDSGINAVPVRGGDGHTFASDAQRQSVIQRVDRIDVDGYGHDGPTATPPPSPSRNTEREPVEFGFCDEDMSTFPPWIEGDHDEGQYCVLHEGTMMHEKSTNSGWVYLQCPEKPCPISSGKEEYPDFIHSWQTQKIKAEYRNPIKACSMRCKCGEPTVIRRCRNSDNYARLYTTCQRSMCQFFAWCDEKFPKPMTGKEGVNFDNFIAKSSLATDPHQRNRLDQLLKIPLGKLPSTVTNNYLVDPKNRVKALLLYFLTVTMEPYKKVKVSRY